MIILNFGIKNKHVFVFFVFFSANAEPAMAVLTTLTHAGVLLVLHI